MERFPKLFANFCRSHAGDLIVEDIAKITEFELLLVDVNMVVNFVRDHSLVKKGYTRIAKQLGGTQLLKFPKTRFALCHLTIKSLLGKDNRNVDVLRALVEDECWAANTATISQNKVSAFVTLVTDEDFFRKVCLLLWLGLSLPLN